MATTRVPAQFSARRQVNTTRPATGISALALAAFIILAAAGTSAASNPSGTPDMIIFSPEVVQLNNPATPDAKAP